MKKIISVILTTWTFILFGGCATLEVTPPYQLKTVDTRMPVTVAIDATGERLREAFNDPKESAVNAASGRLFEKVMLLPDEARLKTPAEIKAAYGADFVLKVNIADVNVHGDLNPLWFATIPLFFFKPLTPIVTFESTVTLNGGVLDAQTGAVISQREVSKSSTDHFSPVKPEDNVRKLTTRSINGALATLLEELHGLVTKR